MGGKIVRKTEYFTKKNEDAQPLVSREKGLTAELKYTVYQNGSIPKITSKTGGVKQSGKISKGKTREPSNLAKKREM